jgi:hypothetical protein
MSRQIGGVDRGVQQPHIANAKATAELQNLLLVNLNHLFDGEENAGRHSLKRLSVLACLLVTRSRDSRNFLRRSEPATGSMISRRRNFFYPAALAPARVFSRVIPISRNFA